MRELFIVRSYRQIEMLEIQTPGYLNKVNYRFRKSLF